MSKDQKKALVVKMTAAQTSLEKCAEVVGTTPRTIQRWAKDDAAFRAALSAAREEMVFALKTEAISIATDRSLPTRDRSLMLMFLLKTLGGLREGGPASPVDQPGQRSEIVGVRYVPTRGGEDV